MGRFAFLAAILSLAALTGCQPPVGVQPSAAASPAAPSNVTPDAQPADATAPVVTLAKAGLQTWWRQKIKLSFREKIAQMWLIDENLYCLTNQGRLVALDAKLGLTKWDFPIPVKDEAIFRPSHPPIPVTLKVGEGGDRIEKTFNAVIINSVSRMFLLDRSDGRVVRDLQLPYSANSAGASDGHNGFIGSVRGMYHCFGLDKGVRLWSRKTDSMISAPLVYFRDYVYVASEDHNFYCTRTGPRGEKEWAQKMDGSVTTGFEVEERGVFVPCEDGKLYAFHPYSGRRLWDPFVTRGYCRTPVQLGRRVAFQYSDGDKFYAVNLSNGAEMWSSPVGRMVVAIIKNEVYLLDKDRNVLITDETRGKVKAVVSLDRLSVFAPNTRFPAIYGASDSGWVLCLNQTAEGFLKPGMLKKNE